MIEDLRRIPRVSVCARAAVQDRYGVWTGVTDDVSARGCQIVTTRLLRVGALSRITLASDMFPEELEVEAQVVWSALDRLGFRFLQESRRPGAIPAECWIEKVFEHGGPENGAAAWVVPSVHRGPTRIVTATAARHARLVRSTASADPAERPLQPIRHA